ncbi:MAG: polysaccharide pyruvyl transferase family protein [Pleurocapsa sp. MO_192.B19]|nr:polysaccharide pyruvyl transferase family protein [Pleurocapsa sp. MO_192.B19]
MKIGIITFHHTTNYGATLQAYALWKAIKQKGYEVEIIDYRSYKVARAFLGLCLPIRRTQIWNSQFIPNSIKAWKMRKFLIDNMDLSRKKSYTRAGLKNFSQDYDVVICGSDEIWHIESNLVGFDSSFFLDFIDSKTSRKISYAPSFSWTKDLTIHKQSICKLISEFDAISVRDNHSLSLIEKECNRSAQKVLDPTFLIDFSEFKSAPKIKKEYLLFYFPRDLGEKTETWVNSWINSVPEFRELESISIGYHSKLADINFVTADPEEWLEYFRNASYIITNSFHGTIFSLKFKRPFTVFTDPNHVKIKGLLKTINLETRIIDKAECNSYPKQPMNINYDLVNETLEKEIVKSKNYLFNAIEGNKIGQLSQKVL